MSTVCHIFVDWAVDLCGRRILYVDGPAVLDWTLIQSPAPARGLFWRAFAQLMAAGELKPLPLEPLIQLVWASCFEAGRYIAAAPDPGRAQEEMRTLLLCLLEGLRSQPASGRVAVGQWSSPSPGVVVGVRLCFFLPRR